MKNSFKKTSGFDIQVTPQMRAQWREDDAEAIRQSLTPPEGIALRPKPPVSTEDATQSLACALAKWAVTAAKKEGQV